MVIKSSSMANEKKMLDSAVKRWLAQSERAVYRTVTGQKQNCKGLSECEHIQTTFLKSLPVKKKKNQMLFIKHLLPGTARPHQPSSPKPQGASKFMSKGTEPASRWQSKDLKPRSFHYSMWLLLRDARLEFQRDHSTVPNLWLLREQKRRSG